MFADVVGRVSASADPGQVAIAGWFARSRERAIMGGIVLRGLLAVGLLVSAAVHLERWFAGASRR